MKHGSSTISTKSIDQIMLPMPNFFPGEIPFSRSFNNGKEVSSRNTSHKSYYSSYVPTLFLITSNVPSINKTPTGNEIHALLVNPAIT